MRQLFYDEAGFFSSFNYDISSWDVSGVTHMEALFTYASSFNGDLSAWDVYGVTNMQVMFGYASSFNGDIRSWDVSSEAAHDYMFSGTTSFNNDDRPLTDFPEPVPTTRPTFFYVRGLNGV